MANIVSYIFSIYGPGNRHVDYYFLLWELVLLLYKIGIQRGTPKCFYVRVQRKNLFTATVRKRTIEFSGLSCSSLSNPMVMVNALFVR